MKKEQMFVEIVFGVKTKHSKAMRVPIQKEEEWGAIEIIKIKHDVKRNHLPQKRQGYLWLLYRDEND